MNFLSNLSNYGVLRWFFAILWTILLTVLLLQPENQSVVTTVIQPAPPSLKRELLYSSMHLLTFGFTALLWCFALNIQSDSKANLAMIVFLLLVYGLSAEYLQMSVPGRSAQWWDMLANSIGIMIACILWLWFKKQTSTVDFRQIHQVSG